MDIEQFLRLVTVYRNILCVLGAAFVFKKLFNSVWSAVGDINAYFLAPWGITRINLRKYGSWASECVCTIDYMYIHYCF